MNAMKQAREAVGLTVEIAAKKAGVAVDTLKRMERGAMPVSWNSACRLSKVYGGCDLKVFLPIKEAGTNPNERGVTSRGGAARCTRTALRSTGGAVK